MDPATHPALALLAQLLDIPSPSGREEKMAAFLKSKIEQLGFDPELDPAGNLLVRLDAKPQKTSRRKTQNSILAGATTHHSMVIASHMDEIAVIVTAIEPDGRLKVDRSGGLYPAKSGECVLDILGDHKTIPGILSMGSMHVADAATRPITWNDVRIITGFSPQRLNELGVRVGTTAVPARAARGPVILGDTRDPLVAAWTFDDRAGIVTLLRLLKQIKTEKIQLARNTIVAFTVHEEGGAHGAKVLAHREQPEIFLAVDGCPVIPGSPIVTDHRPATWSADTKGHYDQRLVRQLLACGKNVGVEVQTAVFKSAYSDASAVYDVGGAPRVAVFGHPRENSHGCEVLRLSVLDNVLKVLAKFVQVVE